MTTHHDSRSTRLPVIFAPHGGGPWPFVELGFPRHEIETLADALRSIPLIPRTDVKQLLVITGHWEEDAVTLTTSEKPPMLYDYYGFPDEAYQLQWPAPGAVDLAAKVGQLLTDAGIDWKTNDQRGYDHGTFIPMKVAFPQADIPVLQMSLRADFDPAFHIELGRALAPLREQGVLIIGSGMSFHNLRAMRQPGGEKVAQQFHDWLLDALRKPEAQRNEALAQWEHAPGARFSHPKEEHLLPLMVVSGAGGADPMGVLYDGTIFGYPHVGVTFGA